MASAKAQSKTARQAVRAGATGTGTRAAAHAGDAKRVVPLNSGRHCYLRTADGRNLHLATDSPAFAAAVAVESRAGAGARLRGELLGLAERFPAHGWDATVSRLDDAGAFQTA